MIEKTYCCEISPSPSLPKEGEFLPLVNSLSAFSFLAKILPEFLKNIRYTLFTSYIPFD